MDNVTLTANQIERATQTISNAKKFIMRYQAFYATLMLGLNFKMINDPDMTMATDGKDLLWSPHFVLEGNQTKNTFVILHEILHVVFKHHLRRGKRNPRLWNNAADYVINALIVHMGLRNNWPVKDFRNAGRSFIMAHGEFSREEYRMPEDGLLDTKYFGMTTETVYDILKKEADEDPDQGDQGQGEENQPGDQGQGQGEGQGDCPWGDVIDGTNDDGEELTAEEMADAEKELNRQINTAANIAKGRGQMPGGISDAITANNTPSQDWRDVLQDMLQQVVPSDFTFARQNRNYLGSDLVVPSIDKDGMGPIGIYADASGSVSPEEFSQFMSDISVICEELQPESVTLIQFDWDCAEPEVIEQGDEPELKRLRTGGTRFSAPFNYAEKHGLDDFEAVIVFTDGGDDQYADEPDCPVIWASTGAFWGGPPPYGEVVGVKFNK
jgi:predicted metal-dependent peptidase|tara:strand:- start:916 stop:2235 length:1320 start_codon:yes stop_codon:yes gene_type:complete